MIYMYMFLYYGYINLWTFLSLGLDASYGVSGVVSKSERIAKSVDPDGTALSHQGLSGFLM